jgi:polysaccharide deacetylase family protein (PEP-CTERM system associated)
MSMSTLVQSPLMKPHRIPECRNQVAEPFHLLTVDVEDWPQSNINHSLPIGNRVLANTHALLELMNDANVQATFFVLGKVAEAHPNLAREIVAAGHEVGTHGYSHDAIESIPTARFREELHRSVDLLRQQTGRPVLGHRAADFSISRHSLHLLECLADERIIYDSSIFPIYHPRYGVPEAPGEPHLVRCTSKSILIEFPPATLKLPRLRLPVAGGGYLRLFPYWVTKFALKRIHREGSLATCYMHPYELDTFERKHIPYPMPFRLRWTQFINRRSVRCKVIRLLKEFRFITMEQACRLLARRLKVALDLGKQPVAYGNST